MSWRAKPSRGLLDYSNRELREVIGDLRIAAMERDRELSEARIELAGARGADRLTALQDEMMRRLRG